MLEVGQEWVLHTSPFRLKETTTPTNAEVPANVVALYAKDSGGTSTLCYKNDASTEVCLPTAGPLVTGSGVANQVALFTGTSTIGGDTGLTFDSTLNMLTVSGLTASGLTAGSVLFAGAAGLVSQDNANLFWDDTLNRLGVGTTTPSCGLQITKVPIVDGANSLNLELADTTAFATGVGGGIGFSGKYNSAGDIAGWAGIKGTKENATDGNFAGVLDLISRANGGLNTVRFRVGSAGQWGIGGATYGTATNVFKSGGAAAAPTWGTVVASEITSGAALTKTDDTNVTLTLGGTPTAALLAASSLTLGWTGTLADARLSTTTVVAAAYGSATASPTFTVGATGRLTAAADVTITPAASSITGGAAVTAASTKITLAGTPSTAGLTAFSIDVNQANLDHGSIGGLADDDHTQYALLAGRSGGQTLIGGTASGNNLTLNTTSHATKGSILFGSMAAFDDAQASGVFGSTTFDSIHPALTAGIFQIKSKTIASAALQLASEGTAINAVLGEIDFGSHGTSNSDQRGCIMAANLENTLTTNRPQASFYFYTYNGTAEAVRTIVKHTGELLVGGHTTPQGTDIAEFLLTSSGARTTAVSLINAAGAAGTQVSLDFSPNTNIALARVTGNRTTAGGLTQLDFSTFNGSLNLAWSMLDTGDLQAGMAGSKLDLSAITSTLPVLKVNTQAINTGVAVWTAGVPNTNPSGLIEILDGAGNTRYIPVWA